MDRGNNNILMTDTCFDTLWNELKFVRLDQLAKGRVPEVISKLIVHIFARILNHFQDTVSRQEINANSEEWNT